MINSVTSLRLLRPLITYSDNDIKEKNTTITSFEEMLREQKLAEKQKSASETSGLTKKLADKTAGNSQAAEQADNDKKSSEDDSYQGVTYRDPSTGASVRYVDVAASEKDKDTSVGGTSGSGKANTTSASSMTKTKYDSYFKKAAIKYNVSESLLKAIAKAESNFNANDVSSAGAIGVMQLMPATAQGLGVKNPYDPEQNIMGGAKCISQKLKEFNGDVRLALAAYNAGSGAVKRYGGVPSYCKTYVNRVLSYKEAYETASAVG